MFPGCFHGRFRLQNYSITSIGWLKVDQRATPSVKWNDAAAV